MRSPSLRKPRRDPRADARQRVERRRQPLRPRLSAQARPDLGSVHAGKARRARHLDPSIGSGPAALRRRAGSRTTASIPPPGASRSSASPPSTSRGAGRSPARARARACRTAAPEAVERPRALLLARGPGPRSTTCSSTQPSRASDGDRHVVRDGERVRDQVVDDLPEPVRRAAAPAVPARPRASRTCRGARAGRRAPRRRRRVSVLAAPASARASESRPSTSRPSRSTSASAGRGILRAEVLEPQPQRGQRRPQLVRGVGDERLLRGEQLLELRRRLVEHARERAAPPRGPSSGARTSRWPAPTSAAASSSLRSGRVTPRATQSPSSETPPSTIPAIAASVSQ